MKSMYFWRVRSGTKRPVAGPHLATAASDLGKRFGRKSKTAAAAAPASGSDDGTHSATPYARSPAPPEGHKVKPWLNPATNAPGSRASWLYRLTPNARNPNSQHSGI